MLEHGACKAWLIMLFGGLVTTQSVNMGVPFSLSETSLASTILHCSYIFTLLIISKMPRILILNQLVLSVSHFNPYVMAVEAVDAFDAVGPVRALTPAFRKSSSSNVCQASTCPVV
jgi:hypothetical protein